MTPLNSAWALAILCAFVFSVSSVSSSQAADVKQSHPLGAQSVSQWVQHDRPLSRSKRAPWDWSLDALKCSLKIISLQVSNYHDNQLMCCGLWWIKGYMKRQANKHCGETANRSIEVFNEMINENLIYSEFAKSLIGDQTADCTSFPEGSPVCDRFFATITLIIILGVLTLVTIIVGFIVSMVMCVRFRKAYLDELGNRSGKGDPAYQKANSESDLSNASSTNNNNIKKKRGGPFSGIIDGLGNRKPPGTKPHFNDHLLKRDHVSLGNAQTANGGRLTPLSDGRCSSASTNSSALPGHDDKV